MQLKSILNRVQKHPSFVYETVRLVEHPQLSIEVRVRPRAGTRATCSQCRRRAPGYDTQAVRRFDFVPLWHIPVVFLYAMRRVCQRSLKTDRFSTPVGDSAGTRCSFGLD